MKFTYQYTEYKNFPKATEISRSRECAFNYWVSLDSLLFIVSVICLIVDFTEFWPMIFAVAISIAWFIYLVKYYNQVTERKIRKAISEEIELREALQNPTYECTSIKVIAPRAIGKCHFCGDDNVALSLCDIKDRKGTGMAPVCNKCIAKFQANVR